jgi:filamentous hemagglutinin family protein
MQWSWKTLFLLTTCCTLGLMTTARAQVSSDGTLSTTVSNPDNLNFTINNGDRVGGNLFHSFREFSVPNGGSAVFQNPLDVQNIISRVTGGSLSQINGLIQAQGSANLFLLNPAGISFGQNARLSIGGSFFATTADSLLFDNGFEFSATNPQAPPLLTVNIPIGLRFWNNPGNITNRSVVQDNTGFGIGLQINPGNSLALVGGNVSLEEGGRLTAAGGRIELGGLAGAGTVGLQTNGNTFRLNFPTNGLSNVSLLDDARAAVRSNGGGDIAVNANIFTATNGGRLVGGIEGIATRNGGDITVNSNEFNISGVGQSRFGAGIYQQVAIGASGNPGNIFVNTKSFNASSGGRLQNTVESGGTGNAGDISITSNSLSLSGGQLQNTVESGGTGNAGNISITSNSLSFTNAVINSNTSGRGNAGNISLQVGDAIALNGSQISSRTFGIGNAGNVTLRAENGDIFLAGGSFIFSTVEPGQDNAGNPVITQRNAGKIDIIAKNLTLTDGSQLETLVRAGQRGNAGNITVQASGDVSFSGFSNIDLAGNSGVFPSGVISSISAGATGSAGDIDIRARSLTLTNASQIQAVLFREDSGLPGGIGTGGSIKINASDFVDISGFDPVSQFKSGILASAETGSTGPGGSIDITTGAFRLSNSGIVTAQTANGNNAGNITINAKTFAISDGGQVTVASQGQGQGGEITITGNTLNLDRGIINASTQSGDGGNINLRLRNFIRLRNESLISANARGQQGGDGGNITINTPFIVAFPQNNDITANAVGGSGGRVTTNATLFGIIPRTRADLERLGVPGLNPRNLSTSDITAFSEQNSNFGDNLQLNSPDVDPSRGLVELPETLTDTTQKIAQSPCRQGFGNEFAVTGRGGLPTSPNETLSSNNVRVDLLQPVASSGNSPSATIKPATTVTARRVPAQGWIFNDKGQVVLTAYDPTNTGSQRPFSTAACPAR